MYHNSSGTVLSCTWYSNRRPSEPAFNQTYWQNVHSHQTVIAWCSNILTDTAAGNPIFFLFIAAGRLWEWILHADEGCTWLWSSSGILFCHFKAKNIMRWNARGDKISVFSVFCMLSSESSVCFTKFPKAITDISSLFALSSIDVAFSKIDSIVCATASQKVSHCQFSVALAGCNSLKGSLPSCTSPIMTLKVKMTSSTNMLKSPSWGACWGNACSI